MALWQAEHVRAGLEIVQPRVDVEVEVVRTTGDRILDVPLARIGDKGLFTKEIDEALLDGRADIAVHSLKDVPTRLPEGLAIGAITEREMPSDVVLTAPGRHATLDRLPAGARVGTSSLRRRAQLMHYRSDLEVSDLRGNLDTRLARLDAGDYDAIILAAAGVLRLGWRDRISEILEPARWLPAVGQGALAVVMRRDDDEIASYLEPLHHAPTAACVLAERAFLGALEGGCQVPIGALATIADGELRLDGFVAGLDGQPWLRGGASGDPAEPEQVGRRLAEDLLGRGAREILDGIRAGPDVPSAPAP